LKKIKLSFKFICILLCVCFFSGCSLFFDALKDEMENVNSEEPQIGSSWKNPVLFGDSAPDRLGKVEINVTQGTVLRVDKITSM